MLRSALARKPLKGLGEPGVATQTAASGFACRRWSWLNRSSVGAAPIQASLRLLSPAGDPVPARDRRSARREFDIQPRPLLAAQGAADALVPIGIVKTVQPSRPAASCKGCSWFSTVWPRSLVETRTYSAARLVDVAMPQGSHGSAVRQAMIVVGSEADCSTPIPSQQTMTA